MKLRLLTILFILSAFGCECPPGADTPKIITPSEHANINIFNAVYSNEYFSIDTKYGIFYNQLDFNSDFGEYIKIGSSNNVLKLKNEAGEYFYTVPLFFHKDSSYTAVIAGNNLDIIPILIEEKFSNLNSSKTWLRVINANRFLDSLKFVINYNINGELAKGKYSDFIALLNSDVNIKIFYGDEPILNINRNFNKSTAYTAIIYYDPKSILDYQTSIRILEHKL